MIRVETLWPLAGATIDHLYPRGTKNDTSDNPTFRKKLTKLMSYVTLLDVGCSGGTFVEEVNRQPGCFAVGIEGSDYSKQTGRASWATIPEKLFTADIAKPFTIMNGKHLQIFNVVTAWEVLEHLNEEGLTTLSNSLHTHLSPLGIFVGSVNTGSDYWNGHEYHTTIEPWEWWQALFGRYGWFERPDLVELFSPDWVRGPNTNGPASYPFVLQRAI